MIVNKVFSMTIRILSRNVPSFLLRNFSLQTFSLSNSNIYCIISLLPSSHLSLLSSSPYVQWFTLTSSYKTSILVYHRWKPAHPKIHGYMKLISFSKRNRLVSVNYYLWWFLSCLHIQNTHSCTLMQFDTICRTLYYQWRQLSNVIILWRQSNAQLWNQIQL